MNKIVAVLVGMSILMLGPSAEARPHHGRVVAATGCYDASPGVVTRWEYNHAEVGMTRGEIACLFGTSGFNAYFWPPDNTYTVVQYQSEDPGKVVTIRYHIEDNTQVLVEKFIS